MKLTTIKTLSITGFIALASFVLIGTGQSHAASITVATGADENTDNASCSLTEAIQNVNDQPTQTNTDCPAADGVNDTIAIPAGTITLITDLQGLTESVVIQGRGMGKTIIDGDGQWSTLSAEAGNFEVRDLTVTAAKEIGVFARNANAVFSNIEIDGDNWGVSSDPGGALMMGVGFANVFSQNNTASITNIYVHNFNIDASQFFGIAVIGGGDVGDINFDASNITVEHITNTGTTAGMVVGSGIFNQGAAAGTVGGKTDNLTVSGLTSTTSSSLGYAQTVITQGVNELETYLTNSTIADLNSNGTNFIFGMGGAVALVGAAGTSSNMVLNTTNLLIAPGAQGCTVADIGDEIDPNTFSGTVTSTIVSHGGNLSDDNTCSSYFTKSTDQNNVTTLSNFLAPIANNGGLIPTLALLQGSPAIDAGVPVAGLATDARQAARPQGNAFDTGAYESPFTRASLAGTGENVMGLGLITGLMIVAPLGFIVKRRTA